MAHNKNTNSFSRADISNAIRIWEHAALSLMDIRHNLISADEAVRNYCLPASTFIYTSGASAEILLNGQSFRVNRFGVFHGGKGTTLSILPSDGWLEYYMLLYKTGEPPFHKKEFAKLLEHANPFRQQYGFAPSNPLFFGHQLRLMYEKWKGPTTLNLFYAKAAFYQLVYEVYEELENGQIQVFEPDLIGMASRYIDQHYSDAITIQEVCDMLGISYSHFHRLFTRQLGKSPQEYLIQTRLAAAIECLNNKEVSIREVVQCCGFSDEYNFHRLFFKSVGMTPGAYREKSSAKLRDDIIGNILSFPYNEQNRVSHSELKGKGATFMFKQMKGKAVVAAALSLMLLMSACSTAPANSSGVTPAPTSTVTGQTPEATKTTRTIHMQYGDVEIPNDPQRVIIAYNQGDLMALGITPVGATFSTGAAFEEQTKNIEIIDGWSVNQEELMALEPDLIIWGYYDENDYNALSKVAPTLAEDFYSMEYQNRLRFFGEVFNCSEKAEQVLSSFEQKLEGAKTQLEKANILDKTIVCVESREDFIRTFREGRGGVLVYDLLGFSVPEKLEAAFKKNSSVDLSFEVIPEYAGDFILLNADSSNQLIDNPVWDNLPAVKEGRLIKASKDMFWFNDMLSMSAQLDVIVNATLASQG